ncbi:threonine--tRNA ligase [Agaribacterium haliotis]|uniref:threonine--tRNA ligase n=1 Tax=Agaribacterium haliotis TaxID=2013869 RepID=UPI000BB52BA8|nr:threonine--tRNA ligase [Agaribacterium haliotis]
MNKQTATIVISLPDGSKKTFPAGVSALDIAASIGPGLAKSTVAAELNGELVDACDAINADATIRIITTRDNEALAIIRHSCAHLVGHAVKQLYPEAQMVIGPVIEHGFYYDIAYQRPFTEEDLAAIEARMKHLIASHYDVIKKMTARDKVIQCFDERKEHYKLQLIDDMPNEQQMGLYYHQEYVDMCRGPHVPNTRFLEHVKLTKISGAYWRGDAKNEQLQRIYGTAWATKKDLRSHLTMLAEAQKRDHRRLGKELGYFHFHEAASGAVFWQNKGWILFSQLIAYMRRQQQRSAYIEVNTPDMMDRALWEKSGHWQNYQDHMYSTQTPDEKNLALKPMSCPGSVLMYQHGLKSYRDLPIRMAEFGKVHRYEPSGSLHGLMRVRHFTQDDAHIYCSEQQMLHECIKIIRLVLDIYQQLGFADVSIKLSTRPDKKMGDDKLWDLLEQALIDALASLGLSYQLNPGEGAFYGPKLEFVLRDAIGRDWQCGTLQVDMNLPSRFSLEYVDENGERKVPVLLHRALFGSLERFIGILIEHYSGKLPAWLSPVQLSILTISEAFNEYAALLEDLFCAAGLRVIVDNSKEKVGYKIRQQTMQKCPFMIIVGANEVQSKQLNLRLLNGEQLSFDRPEVAVAYLQEACCAPDLLDQPQALSRSIDAVLSYSQNDG